MRRTIIGFVLLQVAVWYVVFKDEQNPVSANFYEGLSDTWEVVNVNNQAKGEVLYHYPTFRKLTLNSDGSYIRMKLDGAMEQGKWHINEAQTHIVLNTGMKVEKFEIIQLPSDNDHILVIKEFLNKELENNEFEYKLSRL